MNDENKIYNNNVKNYSLYNNLQDNKSKLMPFNIITQQDVGRLWSRISLKKCLQLSNFGNFLKLIEPNKSWKIFCGWLNQSCKVIFYKMAERKIEYHGSKSITGRFNLFKNIIIVKEQRVEDSWSKIYTFGLRFTLMGRVNSYQFRILSNQINI